MQNNFSEQSIQYIKQLLSIKLAICSSKRILHVKSRPMIPCPWDLALNNSLWHFLSEIFAHPFTLYRFTTPNLYFTPVTTLSINTVVFQQISWWPSTVFVYIYSWETHLSWGTSQCLWKNYRASHIEVKVSGWYKKIREVSWDLTGW